MMIVKLPRCDPTAFLVPRRYLGSIDPNAYHAMTKPSDAIGESFRGYSYCLPGNTDST
jgi:hypothetical protein